MSGRLRFSSNGREASASGVQRKGHGKALQTSWPSTAQRARQDTTDVVAIHSTKGTARHYRRRGHPQHRGHGKALQTSWPSTAQRARQGTTDVVAIHSTEGTARHYRRRGHPLQPRKSPVVTVLRTTGSWLLRPRE